MAYDCFTSVIGFICGFGVFLFARLIECRFNGQPLGSYIDFDDRLL